MPTQQKYGTVNNNVCGTDGGAKTCTEENETPNEIGSRQMKKINCTASNSGTSAMPNKSFLLNKPGKNAIGEDIYMTDEGDKHLSTILETMGMNQRCKKVNKNIISKQLFNTSGSAKTSAFGMLEMGVALQATDNKTFIDSSSYEQDCGQISAQLSNVANAYTNLNCKLQKNSVTTDVKSVTNSSITIYACMGNVFLCC